MRRKPSFHYLKSIMSQLKTILNIEIVETVAVLIALVTLSCAIAAETRYSSKDERYYTTLRNVNVSDSSFIENLDSVIRTTHLRKFPHCFFVMGNIRGCEPQKGSNGVWYVFYDIDSKSLPCVDDETYILLWGSYNPNDLFGERITKYKKKYYIFPHNTPDSLISETGTVKKFDYSREFSIKVFPEEFAIPPIVVKWKRGEQMELMDYRNFTFY